MIKYLDARSAISSLRDRILKVSEAGKFNDPYEFELVMTGREKDDLPEDFVRKVIDHNVRVFCVSNPELLDSDGDILMWSHYGEKHTGCRIHLAKEFLESRATVHWEVEYESSVPIVNMDCIGDDDMLKAFMALSQALRSKGKFWSYEKEVRFYFKKRECNFSRKHDFHYLSLSPDAIERVDLGIGIQSELEREIIDVLAMPDYRHVQLYNAERKRGRFEIEYRLKNSRPDQT